jgi:hypothetical protein
MELQEAFDAGFAAVKKYVDDGFGAFEARIKALEDRAPAQGEPGLAGKDGPSDEAVSDMVARAVAALPKPAAGADGKDGRDADEEAITARIMEAVIGKVAQIQVPKDGTPGADGKDGVGLAGALIDRDGALVVSLTDGTQKNLGRVIGKDGTDGAAGNDGTDALGFDDLSIEFDGDRSFKFVMVRGEARKEFGPFTAPWPLDRGVFKESTDYKRGDATSWGGSVWIAQRDTSDKPETSDAWRLAVKRGRDGKDGVMKVAKEQGPVRLSQ